MQSLTAPEIESFVRTGGMILAFVFGVLHIGNRLGKLETKLDLLLKVCPKMNSSSGHGMHTECED